MLSAHKVLVSSNRSGKSTQYLHCIHYTTKISHADSRRKCTIGLFGQHFQLGSVKTLCNCRIVNRVMLFSHKTNKKYKIASCRTLSKENLMFSIYCSLSHFTKSMSDVYLLTKCVLRVQKHLYSIEL